MLALKPISKDLSRTKPALYYCVERGKKNGLEWSSMQLNASRKLYGKRDGFTNPDWRNKVRRKEDATTPMVLSVDDIKYVNIQDTYKYRYLSKSENSDYTGVLSACPAPEYLDGNSEFPGTIDTNWSCYKEARNIALTYQRKYVSEVTQPFQSQVFLGEIKETLDFIRHPFGKLKALANSAAVARYNAAIKHYQQVAIKHRGGVFSRTSEAKLLLGDIADAWFEVRFAMLPLVSDVTAALTLVTNGRTSKKRSSFRGDSAQLLSTSEQIWPMGSLSGYRVKTRSMRCKYYINTGIIFDDSTSYTGFAEYLQDSTSSLVDWIPTIYELVPGSWLVDYFVNVGDILNSIATSSKVTKAYDCHTAIVDVTHSYSWRLGNQGPNISIQRSGPSARTDYTRRFVQRSVSTDSFPSVTYRLPSGSIQLANTALYLSRKFANIFR